MIEALIGLIGVVLGNGVTLLSQYIKQKHESEQAEASRKAAHQQMQTQVLAASLQTMHNELRVVSGAALREFWEMIGCCEKAFHGPEDDKHWRGQLFKLVDKYRPTAAQVHLYGGPRARVAAKALQSKLEGIALRGQAIEIAELHQLYDALVDALSSSLFCITQSEAAQYVEESKPGALGPPKQEPPSVT